VIAFISSLLASLAMFAVVVLVGKRRAPGTPLTWGEAFVAGTFVFFLLFLLYGVVPHQWLTWADNELNWRRDEFFFGESGITFFGRGAIQFPKEVLRDIVATVIYVVFLVAQIVAWKWWQTRGQRAASERPRLVSSFGRPLVRKV
jgi:hypothetical protein